MLTSRYSLVACISSNIRMNFSPLELFDMREESTVQPACPAEARSHPLPAVLSWAPNSTRYCQLLRVSKPRYLGCMTFTALPTLTTSSSSQHQQHCCKVRNSREDLCAPARSQREETGPQISSRIYGSAAVAGHWHGDPQYDDRHYGRNQLRGSWSVSLFVQAQDAQHQHASAHDLSEVKTSTVKQDF